MKIAIFESIVTPAGHEVDFDRMLVDELRKAGHQVMFFVPEHYTFKLDYGGVPVHSLPGEAVSYTGASGLRKLVLAGKREIRRRRWFNALSKYAREGVFDALIIPTATYRFLRTLRMSALKNAPVAVIPLLHGINPGEAAKFVTQVKELAPYPAVKITVITLFQDIFGAKYPNVRCVLPPVFPPLGQPPANPGNDILTLGFFGQYRREKNLDAFLKVYLDCKFTVPVRLLVQGATVLPEDAADFERIQRQYKNQVNITFLHKALIGQEWRNAIAGVDALIMPYSAERYLYHWSAMLFTALGFGKPVIIADTINPQVLASYNIGAGFNVQDAAGLKNALERFVNTYKGLQPTYEHDLSRAKRDFAPARFVRQVMEF